MKHEATPDPDARGSTPVQRARSLREADAAAESTLRLLANQALSRAGGAPLVAGNSARILRDAGEHFPAWLSAIGAAKRVIYLENYIIADDEVGREFVGALADKAREGVCVRVIYDWWGSWLSGRGLWSPLIDAGGEVRAFNPPHLASPFGWIPRDHRKMLAVDGQVGFVTGLCVSSKWLGDPARNVAPWRDTGIEVRGPAVADIEQAFAQTWAECGPPIPADELTPPANMPFAGDVALRVLATAPNIAGLYRLDQLVAAMARRTLWLTDAYFVGAAPYVQALRAAALDGVDVRLLVPGSSDLMLLNSISRSGFRVLLEAGVRVFEWNGSMLHAKTAVADGQWARIGSSNLNLASWLGNYELDVTVEDVGFARAMEEMYEEDLANSTEIVLDARRRLQAATARERSSPSRRRGRRAGAAAGALRISHVVGAAVAGRRVLGTAESGIMASAGVALLGLAAVALIWPLALALPVAVLSVWTAVGLFIRARALKRERQAEGDSTQR